MNTSLSQTFRRFLSFIALFIGTGFIAGSIVHFGEGVTIWDSSVLIIGILLFVGASFVQEYGKHHERSTPGAFALFILQSLLLAIGIGMASGGTQHFIDTPEYAAILIPLGLSIGLFSYFWREKLQISGTLWISVFAGVMVTAGILWIGLTTFNTMIPDSLRVGHGSHGHSARVDDQQTPDVIDSERTEHFDNEHIDDGHGH